MAYKSTEMKIDYQALLLDICLQILNEPKNIDDYIDVLYNTTIDYLQNSDGIVDLSIVSVLEWVYILFEFDKKYPLYIKEPIYQLIYTTINNEILKMTKNYENSDHDSYQKGIYSERLKDGLLKVYPSILAPLFTHDELSIDEIKEDPMVHEKLNSLIKRPI